MFDACFAGREIESWDEKLIQTCETEVDLDADGRIDQRLVNEYDEQGRLIEMSAGSMLLNRTEYSDDGRTVTVSSYGFDGGLRSQEVRSFDDAFNLVMTEEDEDGDGDVDVIARYHYLCWEESDERLPGPCVVETDRDADGNVDEITTSEYDSEERIVLSTRDHLEDGSRSITTYSYGETTERVDYDEDGDGMSDASAGTDFDEDGSKVREWRDNDGDGAAEQSTDYEYDDQGRKVLELIMNRDGTVARKELRYEDDGRRVFETTVYEDQPELNGAVERRYDSAGNLLGTASDNQADGTLDSCSYVSYACWAE